jgi:hypothetical protein
MQQAMQTKLESGASMGDMLALLLECALAAPVPGEDAEGFADDCVTAAPDARAYSMGLSLAHKLKALILPADQRALVNRFTGVGVNSQVLADPLVAAVFFTRCCCQSFFLSFWGVTRGHSRQN